MSEIAREASSKILAFAIAIAGVVLIFTTTENCFDEADVRNSITMVKTLKARPASTTIPEALVRAHPPAREDQIAWSGTITNRHYGFVRVRAAIPAPGEVVEYLFDVNLAGQKLHPANELSRDLMKHLGPSRAAPADAPQSNTGTSDTPAPPTEEAPQPGTPN